MTETTLHSLDSTLLFGRILGELCEPGDVICLKGNLGAGKTTLTQAIAEGAGVKSNEYVTSPTFSIMHEYSGRIPLYHMDFYRLNSGSEVLDMGLEDYFYLSGVTVIEWYERAEESIPEEHLVVHLSCLDETSRTIRCASKSAVWKNRIDILFDRFTNRLSKT